MLPVPSHVLRYLALFAVSVFHWRSWLAPCDLEHAEFLERNNLSGRLTPT